MASTKEKNTFRKSVDLLIGKKALWFTIPFLIFLIIGIVFILALKKGDILLALNSVSSPQLDKFFLQVTKIGLGSFMAIIGAFFIFYKFRWSLLVFINLAWVGIFTNLFKRVLFHLTSRPMHYFYYDDFHRFLYDAPLSYYNTFPSGHTMTIYAICSLMAVLINKKLAGLFLFLLALIVGFSRIYLLQHFFIDTYFGAITGIIATILTFWLDQKLKLEHRNIWNLNLQKVLFEKKS